ncbi:hypothetical protein GCM10027035_48830 [Emticicia sediminis]
MRVFVVSPHNIGDVSVILGAVGLTPVLREIILLIPLSPQRFTQVAPNVPDTANSIVEVVAPVFQLTCPLQPEAVNIALSPSHIKVLLEDIIGFEGAIPVVIVIRLLSLLSPHELLHVAEYVPATEIVILGVALPVFHRIVPLQPVADKIVVSLLHKLNF